jgi:hypothetical protein
MDWNVQCDTRAAQILAATTKLTLVTLPATLKAHLGTADLPRLRAAGSLGALLARQGEDHAMAEFGRAHAGLPDDLLNFSLRPGGVCGRGRLDGCSHPGAVPAAGDGWRGAALQPSQDGSCGWSSISTGRASPRLGWGPSSWPNEGHHRARPPDPGKR